MSEPIDLISPEAFRHGHPWAQYAWLRANAPVYRHAQAGTDGFWAITKYDDIRTISRQPMLFSSAAKGPMLGEPTPEELAPNLQMMLFMDPPQHDRFKLLVSRGFTPKNSQLLAGRIHELTREIIDDVADRGSCDLVADIAGRLPSGLIAELMGIPRSDGERLYELTEIMHTTDDAVHSRDERTMAVIEMLTYAQGVIDAKRHSPGNDIASALVQAEIDGDRLSDGELQFFFLLLVNAGGDTTRNLVAAGMQQLFDHPDQRARLVADLDGLLPTAVDEMSCTTPRCAACRWRPATAWWCSTARRIATRTCSSNRTASTSVVHRTRTSPSVAAARTSASACTSLVSRSQPCSASCSPGWPTCNPTASPSSLRRASSPA
jgi:cytochrome P450